MAGYRYLLGDNRREAARLRAQAKLWDPVSHALFDRIGVRPGWRVLEIGPGQGSLHLELRRRVEGSVDSVERSPAFAAALARACFRDGFGTAQIWKMDLLAAPLPRDAYDFIFARWVFLFLPDPEAHVRQLVRALKPGGVLAIQDYHRETFAMAPKPPEWNRLLAADLAFFASQGGDASIGGRLPDMYRRAGLAVTDIEITIKTGAPGSPVWSWLTSYFLGVLDRYATFPPFTRRDAVALRRHWLAAGRHKTSKLIGPALLDVVGRKPGRDQGSGMRAKGQVVALCVCIIAASSLTGAQARVVLPDGVAGVSFGNAQRFKDASGKERCSIVQPLADPPEFERGVKEISYGVHLQPRAVKSASTQVVAPTPQGELQRAPCHAFTLVRGGFSQTQLGSTLSRSDQAPLASGKYLLRITIDGWTADVPFTIK